MRPSCTLIPGCVSTYRERRSGRSDLPTDSTNHACTNIRPFASRLGLKRRRRRRRRKRRAVWSLIFMWSSYDLCLRFIWFLFDPLSDLHFIFIWSLFDIFIWDSYDFHVMFISFSFDFYLISMWFSIDFYAIFIVSLFHLPLIFILPFFDLHSILFFIWSLFRLHLIFFSWSSSDLFWSISFDLYSIFIWYLYLIFILSSSDVHLTLFDLRWSLFDCLILCWSSFPLRLIFIWSAYDLTMIFIWSLLDL